MVPQTGQRFFFFLPMKFLETYVHGGVAKGFMTLGKATARKPWTFVMCSLLAALLVGSSFFTSRVMESRPDRLWVPAGTVALADQDRYSALFKSRVRREWMIIEPSAAASSPDMLSKANLQAAMAVHQIVASVTANVSGVTYNYTSLCLKSGGECVVQGALTAWGLSMATLNADATPAATLRAWAPQDSTLRSRVGGATFGPGPAPAPLLSGKGIKTMYMLENRQVFDKKSGRYRDAPAEAWEKEYLAIMRGMHATVKLPAAVTVAVDAQRSRSDEFGVAIRGDLQLIGIAYVLMIGYLVIQLGDRCCCAFGRATGCCDTGTRVALSFAGVAATGLGILMSYGLATICGIFFGPVHNVLPFILLGLGVDDCFVIFGAFHQPDVLHLPLEQRMGRALSRSGASIMLTSVTDFIAFMVGSSSRLPALSSFCQYAALGVLMILLLQVTFFAPCVVLDHLRREQKRQDCCCCFSTAGCGCCGAPKGDGDDADDADAAAPKQLESGGAAAAATTTTPPPPPAAVRGLPKLLGDSLVPALSKFRLPLALFILALLGVTCWGASELRVEDRRNDFIPKASYMHDTIARQAALFCQEGEPTSIVTVDADFAAAATQAKLEGITVALTGKEAIAPFMKSPTTHPDRTYNWANAFAAFLASGAGPAAVAAQGGTQDSTAAKRIVEPAAYYKTVDAWLQSAAGRRYAADVVWKDRADPTAGIKASRAHAEHVSFQTCAGGTASKNDVEKMVSSMMELRATLATAVPPSAATGSTYAFSFNYPGWEGLNVIRHELIMNVVLAIAAVFVVVFVLIANFFVAALVCLCVAFTIIELLGTMYFWGLAIDTVSVINLVLAVGLAVDYAAHIAHCFMMKQGGREERVAAAMRDIGAPVVNGAISTSLAVICLAGSDSYVFVVLFKQLFATCVFGVFNGLVTLPLMLMLVGPDPHAEISMAEFSGKAVIPAKVNDVSVTQTAPKALL